MSMLDIYNEIRTDDMSYPAGMTNEEADAIFKVHERMFLAWEMAYQMENPDDYLWAADALVAIERGDTTYKEIFEEAFAYWWNEDKSYVYLFDKAMERLT